MKKLEDGVAVATFLAMAGLRRLGRTKVARSAIAPEEMLPAVAQGAIGVERRSQDTRVAAASSHTFPVPKSSDRHRRRPLPAS